MTGALAWLMRRLGVLGIASLAVLAASLAAHVGLVAPLQERSHRLAQELGAALPSAQVRPVKAVPQAQLAAFYGFFERRESADMWLAKLYGVAAASGLDWRSADYRLADARHRLERYHISLPVTGTYAQIRKFLEGALVEVPVASLDHISFRRKESGEPRVEADIVLTLHRLAQ